MTKANIDNYLWNSEEMDRNKKTVNGWVITEGDYINPDESNAIKRHEKIIKREKLFKRLGLIIVLSLALAAFLFVMQVASKV